MQVARNLGKTWRAFQPTIRELQVYCDLALLECFWLFHLIGMVDLSTYYSPHRKFLENSKALWSGRLVLMTIQGQWTKCMDQTMPS